MPNDIERPLTVFVVDDDPAVANAVKRILERDHFDVRCFTRAGDVRLAITQAALLRTPVDVVLLDMRLDPNSESTAEAEDLLDVTTRRQPRPEVVVMSGHLSAEEFMRLVLKGATDYLSKPFDSRELARRVADAAATGRQKHLHYQSRGSAVSRMRRDAFLSYSSKNADLALGLKRLLERMGISTWYAAADLDPGDHWPDSLDAAIHACSVFVVLATTESIESEHVGAEVNKALAKREQSPQGFLLIPVSFGLRVEQLPDRLRELHALDLSDQRAFADNVIRLADRISAFVADRRHQPEHDRRRADRRYANDRRTGPQTRGSGRGAFA